MEGPKSAATWGCSNGRSSGPWTSLLQEARTGSMLAVMLEQSALDQENGPGFYSQPSAEPACGHIPEPCFDAHRCPSSVCPPSRTRGGWPLPWLTSRKWIHWRQSAKRLALTAPKQKATPPNAKATESTKEGEGVTRKQLRAKKWAEQRSEPGSLGLGDTCSRCPSFPRGAEASTITFWSWAASLPRLLLATRTAFARFLSSTFKICLGSEKAPPTALFPLPVPKPGCFDAGNPKLSSKSSARKGLRDVLLARLLHITVMAFNFLHSDGKPVPLESLRRQPSQVQLEMTGRPRGPALSE